MNSLDGRIKANAAIVPGGTGDAVSVYVTDTTNVVLDIDGYFEPSTAETLAVLSADAVPRCRHAQIRTAPADWALHLQAKWSATSPCWRARAFPAAPTPSRTRSTSPPFPIPAGSELGYLTVWPSGQRSRIGIDAE